MNLSGENKYSGSRSDEMTEAQLIMTDSICNILGISGMAGTFKLSSVKGSLPTRQKMSYKFNIERSGIVPMPSKAKYLLA